MLSKLKLIVLPLLIVVIPISFSLIFELWEESHRIDHLHANFDRLTKSTDTGTFYIGYELINISEKYQSCNKDFLTDLRDLKYQYPAITDAYVVNRQGDIICANETVSIDISGINFNSFSKLVQVERLKNSIIIYRYHPEKEIYIAWMVSLQYVWGESRLHDDLDYLIVRYYNDDLVMVNNQTSYYNDKETLQFSKDVLQVEDNSFKSTFNVRNYTSSYNDSINIELYYKDVSVTQLGYIAKIRLFVISIIALILALFTFRRIKNDPVQQIKLGITNGEFNANFQPIVCLNTREWVGAEALIRWYKRGEIHKYPDQFIPVAEQHHLASFFHDVCVSNGINLLKQLAPLPQSFFISVNISPNDLSARQIKDINTKLKQENLIKHFEVEVTERGISLDKSEKFKLLIEQLSDEGIKVSLDDFGTGQSGLSYINSLHFDKIKIDKRFVQAINTDTIDFHILTTIIELANKLDVSIVAEGIETNEQKNWLIEHGIKYGQGWLFHRDLPDKQFINEFLRQNSA